MPGSLAPGGATHSSGVPPRAMCAMTTDRAAGRDRVTPQLRASRERETVTPALINRTISARLHPSLPGTMPGSLAPGGATHSSGVPPRAMRAMNTDRAAGRDRVTPQLRASRERETQSRALINRTISARLHPSLPGTMPGSLAPGGATHSSGVPPRAMRAMNTDRAAGRDRVTPQLRASRERETVTPALIHRTISARLHPSLPGTMPGSLAPGGATHSSGVPPRAMRAMNTDRAAGRDRVYAATPCLPRAGDSITSAHQPHDLRSVASIAPRHDAGEPRARRRDPLERRPAASDACHEH